MKLRNHLLSISIYRIMIQQAETKIRQSNFELLRLVAMFMIVLGHANQSSIGVVSREDIFSNPFDSFLRLFLQQFCTVSVNVFILISGWFGIRSTIKGFANMMFQVFFFSSIILIGALMLHVEIHPQSYFTLIGGGIGSLLNILCFIFYRPFWIRMWRVAQDWSLGEFYVRSLPWSSFMVGF